MEEGFGDGPATSGNQREDEGAVGVDSPAQNDPRLLATVHLSADAVPVAAKPGDDAPLQANASHVAQEPFISAQSQTPLRNPPIDDAPAATTRHALLEPGVTATESKAEVEQEADHQRATVPVTAASEPQQVGGHQQQQPPPQRSAPVPHFVAPSSYLRPVAINRSAMATAVAPEPSPAPTIHDMEQTQGLQNIREFLKVRCGYDVFPLSFRLIVLDHDLLIKKSLNIMIQNSIVSAPLWDSQKSCFAGTLTATDYINVIQYYYQFPNEMYKLDQFRLSSLPDIEKAIGASPIETISVNPLMPLFDAIKHMLSTRARRIPLIDVDDETGKGWVVSVITQYRILKFIAVNNEHNTVLFKKTVRELNMGTYKNIATTRMDNSVLDVIHQMVARNISCVPVVDDKGRVLNVFEAVDIIPCIKGGLYEELNGTIGDALCKRPEDSPGIYTCSEHDRLQSIFDTIRKSRVHRLIVVDDDNKLKGVISLSDILTWVILSEEA
ncbi:Nuclear protein-like protein [Emericellopsis cladophorae]|uniref:Nuclear protein-like protein n=1 Tax=Emericellopsis cladophorae TaxID=2686198 RepID=A0A9P9XZ19_9HYPO|nr:Nuclear protein-like protein [Emericellopsis cladophorae]KAI6780075.1 Nuclear protein-like protein [Emericellopsis cladophorae]